MRAPLSRRTSPDTPAHTSIQPDERLRHCPVPERAFSLLSRRSAQLAESDRTSVARIRDAALVRLADDGFAGTTVRAVATDAGVSPALVMHHIRSKDGLHAACDSYVVELIEAKFAAMDTEVGNLGAIGLSAGGRPAHHPLPGTPLATPQWPARRPLLITFTWSAWGLHGADTVQGPPSPCKALRPRRRAVRSWHGRHAARQGCGTAGTWLRRPPRGPPGRAPQSGGAALATPSCPPPRAASTRRPDPPGELPRARSCPGSGSPRPAPA